MPVIDVLHQSWGTRYWFYCPGCKGGHVFDCRTDGGRPSWTFDGNLERPTFSPSLLITCPGWTSIAGDGWLTFHKEGGSSYRVPVVTVGRDCPATVEGVAKALSVEPTLEAVGDRIKEILDSLPPAVCHSFVRNGRIEFLGDCTHHLAGQTVDLPDIEG